MAEKHSPPPAPAAMFTPQLLQPGPTNVLVPCEKKLRRNPGVLIRWIHSHPNHPYPTKVEKDRLTEKAGMNLRQLNDWFANARRNIKKKGGYSRWKEKHPGHSATLTLSEGELSSQLFRTNPHLDFCCYPHGGPSTPAGAPLGHSPHPCTPLRSPCFGDNAHLAMMNGIGGAPSGLGGPTPGQGDPQGAVPLSIGYYQPQPYIKPLSFPTPTYPPGFSHGRRLDSTQVTPYSSHPVLMDSFMQASPPHAQKAIKLFSMCPHYSYKMAGASGPSPSPAQLSTGSSPYSDTTMSPLFGGQGAGKIEPPSTASTPQALVPQQHSIKEELPWNVAMESQQAPDGSRITYAYYSYMPPAAGHAVNSAAMEPGEWGSGTSDVWASPEQATPTTTGDSEEERHEEENTDSCREASVSTTASSCSVENSWVN